jgi:hypothetical protein
MQKWIDFFSMQNADIGKYLRSQRKAFANLNLNAVNIMQL